MTYSHLQLTFQDLIQGISHWRIWLLLGWQDIRLRYRRSVLGPFWITLSMAVMIYTMGFLYAKLFEIELAVYYPFIAAGLVTWTFIASVINDGANTLCDSKDFILQIKLPFSTYLLRMLTRNVIIFFHNLVAIIPILIFFKVAMTPLLLLILVLNLLLLILCAFCYSFILAILTARYQDIKQLVATILQIFFLLTPILWMPKMLPDRFDFLAEYNPFYQLTNLLRQPLTGEWPSLFTYYYMAGFFAFGFIVMILLLWRSRHRIVFWI